ncbi:beta-xylosidase [Flavitalea sp. BT771]|uniref:GH39 family glycosyl hydrolase n=1 Tax=Flavitalea sp. BT771 TaxID=3063329 RepID=UPI0026E13F53|nr:beta-xylosidase [Flavitalea sp. BT771]MDO6430633.1 beta-xylosidase [Flavitalea sp. BT771]MDV6219227.1 beta-xylosidase [Flavitalea sp. BT771]
MRTSLYWLSLMLLSLSPARGQSPRQITLDYRRQGDSLLPVWAYFGYDEPNYTYQPDGKKLLSELAALSTVPVYVRCHNLLTTGDGTPALKWGSTNAYTEDGQGHPVYDWHIVDSIFDTYVRRGMRPLAEIGFMPEALSTHPQPYRHHWKPGVPYDSVYTGWAYPPNDYKKWGELVYQWVLHSVRRYGEKEVGSWLWEVWNEPNIGYWKGSREDYFSLYDFAADAVKRALPSARIGGPATTGPGWDKAAGWLQDFLAHCTGGTNYATGKKGAPLDFISFHAKGSPRLVDGHVRMNMSPQLGDVARGFSIVSSSIFKELPIYITECDPEGCAACGMSTNPENAYRNGTMYSSYTAASFARIYDLAERYHVNLRGAMSWSFEFEGQRWFDGFRDLATNGVDKPVLNVFRMYGMMPGRRIPVDNPSVIPLDSMMKSNVQGGRTDIHALAVAGARQLTVMVWNYTDDDLPGDSVGMHVLVTHLPSGMARFRHFRIDGTHSNAYEVWRQMGSPSSIDGTARRRLEKAGALAALGDPQRVRVPEKGEASVSFSLPAHAVSLLRWDW